MPCHGAPYQKAKPKRACRCCGEPFTVHFPGHARYCPDCRVQATRIKRQAAMVGALWDIHPDIAMLVVYGLKFRKEWPDG